MGYDIDEVEEFKSEIKEALQAIEYPVSELIKIIRMQDKQIQKLEDKLEAIRLKQVKK